MSLNWVLYDFGGRKAALANATALLAAAKASQEAALEKAFADVAKDYYSAQAAQGALVAAEEIEQTANDSFKAATTRVNKRGSAGQRRTSGPDIMGGGRDQSHESAR